MPPTLRNRASRPRRFVVCGDSPLALRLVNELLTRFGAEVTVVVRAKTRDRAPEIAQLAGVKIIEAAQLDERALRTAGVAEARAVALVNSDDVGNIHAALTTHEINPDLRMVVRMFNMSLGHKIRTLFADCAVLSDSAMAAPSFVAAALGEVAPSHVRLPGRTLYVAHRDTVAAKDVVCGLADTTGATTRLLPADQNTANLVLAHADGPPQRAMEGYRTSRWIVIGQRVRALLLNRLMQVTVALLLIIVVGMTLLAFYGSGYNMHGWGNAIYVTLLDAAGNAVPDTSSGMPMFQRIVQVTLTISGLALLPVATGAIVGGVVRSRQPVVPSQLADHVVVVGLGNVGTRVVRQLLDLGITVVAIEADENARGVPTMRRLDVPIVFGDATREDTQRAAHVADARALLMLSNSDVVNLEGALQARAQRDDLRVVLRLFDDDLAQRVGRVFGFAISGSVSFLAAPAFAAAMVERQVIGTIPIGRQVLMIAEVPIAAGSPLAGATVRAADEQGEARVIALQRRGTTELDWQPAKTYALAPQDRLIMLATRSGLGRVLARSISPVPHSEG
ncbi:MAG TPA: NAD-binding protein [Pseudonocardiaceae bacterium]|nr:NAD-binding protein [Pseudonocardiaceae bacterium]